MKLEFQTPGVAPLEPTDPAAIGRYRLLGRLGAGGMGVVYLVRDPDGGLYALKALAGSHRMETELRARLAREARSLTAIESPHVVRVVDVDTDVEIPYIVMTYAAGTSLDHAVPKGGLSPAKVLEYGTQIAGALDHVHQRGIVHRDLKPQNVIIGPDGVTLVDFGIASLDDEGTTALTRQGTFLGSLAWLAPEVIAGGSADERSDVFGLGLVLGFMALGRNPFGTGRPEAVMYNIMHGQPDLDGCLPELTPIITEALAKDPAQRATTHEVLDQLTALSDLRTQLELQALLDAQTRQAEQTRRELQGMQARQRESMQQTPAPREPVAAPGTRPGSADATQRVTPAKPDRTSSRGFRIFSLVMAVWGVLATAATINQFVLLQQGRPGGTLGDFIGALGIYWPDLTYASGWASLVAALAIGTVSTIMLIRFRATKQPTWVYGLGLAAGLIALAVIPLLLLGQGFAPVDAVLEIWLPLAMQGTDVGAAQLLLWQASGIATVLWTAMCAIGMSPAVQETRSPKTARLAGAY